PTVLTRRRLILPAPVVIVSASITSPSRILLSATAHLIDRFTNMSDFDCWINPILDPCFSCLLEEMNILAVDQDSTRAIYEREVWPLDLVEHFKINQNAAKALCIGRKQFFRHLTELTNAADFTVFSLFHYDRITRR